MPNCYAKVMMLNGATELVYLLKDQFRQEKNIFLTIGNAMRLWNAYCFSSWNSTYIFGSPGQSPSPSPTHSSWLQSFAKKFSFSWFIPSMQIRHIWLNITFKNFPLIRFKQIKRTLAVMVLGWSDIPALHLRWWL